MSAVFVLTQSTSVHMLTDGVAYDASGIIMASNLAKAHALPTLPAAMSCTGPAIMSPLIAEHIASEFESFDDLIDQGEDWLPTIFNRLAEDYRSGDAFSSLYLIGWHEKENCPAAYAMDLWTDDSSRLDLVLGNSRDKSGVTRSRLIKQTTSAGTPLNPELAEHCCNFVIRRNDDHVPEVDLLHLAEIARHECIEGAHWVGGKALLTSIDRKGITQRVVHHWAEDVVGEPITPRPIDWKTWRAERLSANVVIPEGLSRLQRERMMKKAAKGKLRSAS